ncbi:MAG TPA: SgcJ/EcaC family oxidoreductase [Trinickia sp.]|jgi:uncharacterized protein (TIGR02246 family)|nr:SgcJ/EcaC family oxidoreductase [Trinickia sp.]
MKVKALLLTLSVALVSTPALARTEVCKRATQAEIAALFDRWNTSLQTGNPEQVADNYAPRSVLLPTLSNEVRVTREQKVDYFQHFLAKHPVGKIDKRSMIEIDCNTALDAGIYTFKFDDGSVAQARYSYTYKWNGERWLITSHHSSLMPEKPKEQ